MPALSVEVLPPTGGNPHWIVHFDKAHAEPFTVHVKMAHLPRTNLMKIGPFLVENAYQDGTIVVQAPPGSLRGQKLVFHETGVRREDLPKGAAGTDAVALFRIPTEPAAGRQRVAGYRLSYGTGHGGHARGSPARSCEPATADCRSTSCRTSRSRPCRPRAWISWMCKCRALSRRRRVCS